MIIPTPAAARMHVLSLPVMTVMHAGATHSKYLCKVPVQLDVAIPDVRSRPEMPISIKKTCMHYTILVEHTQVHTHMQFCLFGFRR